MIYHDEDRLLAAVWPWEPERGDWYVRAGATKLRGRGGALHGDADCTPLRTVEQLIDRLRQRGYRILTDVWTTRVCVVVASVRLRRRNERSNTAYWVDEYAGDECEGPDALRLALLKACLEAAYD